MVTFNSPKLCQACSTLWFFQAWYGLRMRLFLRAFHEQTGKCGCDRPRLIVKSHCHNGLCIGQCKTHHSWTITESTSSLLICAREPLAIICSIFSLLTKWYSTPSWPLALKSTWSLKIYSERSTWTYARLKSSRETILKKNC